METIVRLRSIRPVGLKPGEVILVETGNGTYTLRIRIGAHVSFTGGRYVLPTEGVVVTQAIIEGESLMVQCGEADHIVRTSPIKHIAVILEAAA